MTRAVLVPWTLREVSAPAGAILEATELEMASQMSGVVERVLSLIPRLEALVLVQPRAPELRLLPLSQIESGMTLAADVKSKTGMLLMAHGQLVSEALLQRMKDFHVRIGVVEPILCEVPPAEEEALPPPLKVATQS
jgi:hypothetical protein